ncbi:MAG: LPXTG cell wall anchor domain-containing protein [Clostridia bacterium]|nr:LPXTG cell wall anchor domain-containing protein [Clostridia bacterium]
MKKTITFMLLLVLICLQMLIPISAENNKNTLTLEEADELLMTGYDLLLHIQCGGYYEYNREGFMFPFENDDYIIRYTFLSDCNSLKYSVYPNGKKALFEGKEREEGYHKISYTTPNGDVLITFTEFRNYLLSIFDSRYEAFIYEHHPKDPETYILHMFGDEEDNILSHNGSPGEPSRKRTRVEEIYSFKCLDDNKAIAYVWYQYLEGYDEVGHLLPQRCLETVEFTNTGGGWKISGGTLFDVLCGMRDRSNYNPNTGDASSYTVPALTVAAIISVALPVTLLRKRRRVV